MDLFKSPGFLVNRLAHLMANEIERRFKTYGVTKSWWAILNILWQREGVSQVEIQQRLRLEGATVTGLLQRMEQAELIRRQSDGRDRRIQLVFLTEQGSNLQDVLVPQAEEVNELALRGITKEERAVFTSIMTRALKNFDY
jgi:DNA-binding MarR family transcriptional regulator